MKERAWRRGPSARRGRGKWCPGILVAAVLVACGDSSTETLDRPELRSIEVTFGLDQSAVEGEFLTHSIIADAIVEGGGRYFGTVFARIDQGNGRIDVPGASGFGNGTILQGSPFGGTITFQWEMGSSDEEQRIVLFALRNPGDTVFGSVSAISLPAVSGTR